MLPALLRSSRCNWACSGERREACSAGLWVVPAASRSRLLAANRCRPWAGERVSAARGEILHPCLSVWSVCWQMKGHLQSTGKGVTVGISKQDTNLPSKKGSPNKITQAADFYFQLCHKLIFATSSKALQLPRHCSVSCLRDSTCL